MFENLMVLLFEAFGTGLFTCAFISTNFGLSTMIAYFMILIMCFRISGSHLNPIISLAYMIRKDPGEFHRWIGILYMLAQLGGSFLGVICVFYWFGCKEAYLTVNEPKPLVIQCMISEIFGGFILTLTYMT